MRSLLQPLSAAVTVALTVAGCGYCEATATDWADVVRGEIAQVGTLGALDTAQDEHFRLTFARAFHDEAATRALDRGDPFRAVLRTIDGTASRDGATVDSWTLDLRPRVRGARSGGPDDPMRLLVDVVLSVQITAGRRGTATTWAIPGDTVLRVPLVPRPPGDEIGVDAALRHAEILELSLQGTSLPSEIRTSLAREVRASLVQSVALAPVSQPILAMAVPPSLPPGTRVQIAAIEIPPARDRVVWRIVSNLRPDGAALSSDEGPRSADLTLVWPATIHETVLRTALATGAVPRRYRRDGVADPEGAWSLTLRSLRQTASRWEAELGIWKLDGEPCFTTTLRVSAGTAPGESDVVVVAPGALIDEEAWRNGDAVRAIRGQIEALARPPALVLGGEAAVPLRPSGYAHNDRALTWSWDADAREAGDEPVGWDVGGQPFGAALR